MTIWTIYNHGTGGSSLKPHTNGEIVNLFGNNDPNLQYRGKIITEGVGSIGDPHKLAREYSRTGDGEYWVETTQGKASAVSRVFNSGTGGGVKENVDNTIEFIRALNLNGQKPDGINMIGWSRGAVTCTRIAWALYKSKDQNLRDIPINIFAVDPVAGILHTDEPDARTIMPNVKNYFATLAMGERRRMFFPNAGDRLIVHDPNVTRHWVLPVPGNHSDTAKNNNKVGKLVFNLAYRFLDSVQTRLPAMQEYRLSDIQAWRHYEDLILGEGDTHTTSIANQIAFGGVGYKRRDEIKVHDYGESFFPNVHARLLMLQVFPLTYDAYFGGNARLRNTPAWRHRVLPAITAEQRFHRMAPAVSLMLESLPPAESHGVGIPANVLLMANRLRLVG